MPSELNAVPPVYQVVAVALMTVAATTAQERIGTIDFYGYAGEDLEVLRSALPFREGDSAPSKQQLTDEESAYARAMGRTHVKFGVLCCLPNGNISMFVGLEEKSAAPIVFNPRPNGRVQLARHIRNLSKDIDREIGNAVRQNEAGEDDSAGYSLSSYGPARVLQLRLRDYARSHAAAIIRVLESCPDDEQRAGAAEALGYARESERQIAALVNASFDLSDDVRNNAIRALIVLTGYDHSVIRRIPVKRYLPLLHSLDWLDRNKTSALIDSLTVSRDAEVLSAVRSGAVVPLQEMARWKSRGHASFAFHTLGRLAGFDEGRIVQLFMANDLEPILRALNWHED
jgi:hypothetical protein